MEPQNGGFHLKYAEVMYTYAGGFARDSVGGVAALVIARKYFSAAVELSDGDDVKSLSLLALCCQEIATIIASSGGPKQIQQLGAAHVDHARMAEVEDVGRDPAAKRQGAQMAARFMISAYEDGQHGRDLFA